MTSFIMSIWICVLALMLTSQSCHGESVLTFSATPKSIKQNLTRTVIMRCEVAVNQAVHRQGSTDKEIESVTNYWVTYGEDEYVASVEGSDKAKGLIDEGNLRVSGSASGMGYLELTWVQPAAMRLGTYKCHVNAKSKTNKFVSLKKSLQLTSEELSVTDLLERINKNEQDRKDADTKQVQKLQTQQQTITKLIKCSKQVSFSARVTADQTVSDGSTVVYGNVVTRVGGGYSEHSGTFSCTTPGTYVFIVHGYSGNGQMRLSLYHNSQNVAGLNGGFASGDWYRSGSMSVVRHLRAGDTVKVKATMRSVLYSSTGYYNENSFTGFLLQADGC